MPNTKFLYMYRDAANYKQHGEIVFEGAPTPALVKRLKASLIDGEWFIAASVDVPEVFFDQYDPDDDHPYHEFMGVEATAEESYDEKARTFSEFVKQMERARSFIATPAARR